MVQMELQECGGGWWWGGSSWEGEEELARLYK